MSDEAPREDFDRVYFDGTCGLCHGTVRFLLRRPQRDLFRFAPLQGETFASRVGEARRRELPDSVLVETPEGALLGRSQGVLRILGRLGRPWRALAGVLGLVPRPLRDLAYDLVARSRRRLFRRPAELCPVVPPDASGLFEP